MVYYKNVAVKFRAAERGAGHSMDTLNLFGLFAVTAMLVAYALEDRSHWYILAFAGACALGSVYGFLQGAWPSDWSKRSGQASRCGAGSSCGD